MATIEQLTYNHSRIGANFFFLDRLLTRMPNPAALEKPPSGKRELG